MDYIELNIDFNLVDPWREIVITTLANEDFESFVETKTGLKAYISNDNFKDNLTDVLVPYKNHITQFSHVLIKDRNWNAEWEKNFNPVFVGDKLAILAPFHNHNISHELIIDIQPQMSFGTGHHQTTWLASNRLLDFDLNDKSVLDMGTGTGVLAILAEKQGAKYIYAPDIDEWAYRNAIENCELNQSKNIEIALGGAELLKDKVFDLIIANINKNILIQQFNTYSKSINDKGMLLISGFFKTDVNDLIEEANKHGFIFEKEYTKDEWALVEFIKK